MVLLEQHFQHYPGMLAQDVYKILYQGVRGPEHIIASAARFTAELKEELAGLQPDPNQPLLESVHPDGSLSWLHLRPWLASGAELSQLVEACLRIRKRAWGTSQELQRIWLGFVVQAEADRFPSIPGAAARAFHRRLVEMNFPPVHHSAVFVSLYRPAYRLVQSFP